MPYKEEIAAGFMGRAVRQDHFKYKKITRQSRRYVANPRDTAVFRGQLPSGLGLWEQVCRISCLYRFLFGQEVPYNPTTNRPTDIYKCIKENTWILKKPFSYAARSQVRSKFQAIEGIRVQPRATPVFLEKAQFYKKQTKFSLKNDLATKCTKFQDWQFSFGHGARHKQTSIKLLFVLLFTQHYKIIYTNIISNVVMDNS